MGKERVVRGAYTGIGSRSTPEEVLACFFDIGSKLASLGLTLRSGGADGADSSFEFGCDLVGGRKEIYLPWSGFNGNRSERHEISSECFDIASRFHPTWNILKSSVQRLHARNVYQVLGRSLDIPSLFLLCYTPWNKGGTLQAVRIAKRYRVPVFNFYGGNIYTVEEILNSIKLIGGER